MAKITRQQFQTQHANRSIDPQKVAQDPAARAKLEQGGVSVDQLRRADLNRDGVVDAGEAFKIADGFEQGGPADTVTVREGGQAQPAGKALNALGLLLQNRAAVGSDAPAKPVDLDAVEYRFNKAARKIRKDPAALGQLKGEFRNIIGELDAPIAQNETKLDSLQAQLAKKEAHLGWFEKNIGIFSPDDVRELRGQVDDVQDFIGEAKAYRGGARIALRSGQGDDPDMNPSTWSGRIDSAASKISHSTGPTPERQGAIAGLVKVQDQVSEVTDRAHLEQRAAEGDVQDFSEEVSWHQKWKWLDVIIGGESDRGSLYRTGKDLNSSSEALVGELETVRGRGEQRTVGEINELLKLESPEYLGMRTQYDKLKPAHDGLNEVLGSARDAQSHLRDAEHWIDRRNYLHASEPMHYETVQEPRYTYKDGQQVQNGYDSVTRETMAHKSWQSDYDSAVNMARWATSSAESEVSAVNAQLPGLQRALHELDGGTTPMRLVDDDIGSFWGEMSSFGPWSFDSSQVDQIQGQMRRLENQLNQIKGRVDPEYNSHKSYVDGEISSRRGELRQLDD